MKNILYFIVILIVVACASQEDPIKQEIKNMTARDVYLKANEALSKSSYEHAIKLYNALEVTFPYGIYAEQGMLDLSYAYYKNSNIPMALATIDQFMITYPSVANKDYALYLKGVINYKGEDSLLKYFKQDPSELDVDNLKDSYMAFNQLVNDYPTSKYANDAKKYIKIIINNLAKSELNKASYYISIKAYLAAINHAQQIITNYRMSDYVEEALALEVVAYNNLNQTTLSYYTKQILLLNFPNSKYAKSNWQSNNMSWYKIFN
jgi:outer membrane protein assembly factor BamD